eukprot:897_1
MQHPSNPFKPKNKVIYDGYMIDDRLVLRKKREGILHYIGKVADKKGIWFGIELTSSKQFGKHNGTMDGIQYFKCKSHKGIFVQAKDILRKTVPLSTDKDGIDEMYLEEEEDDETNVSTESDTVITMDSHDLDDSSVCHHSVTDSTNYNSHEVVPTFVKSSKQYRYAKVDDTNGEHVRMSKVHTNRKRSISSPHDTNAKPKLKSRRKRLGSHTKNSSDPTATMTGKRKKSKPVDLSEMIKGKTKKSKRKRSKSNTRRRSKSNTKSRSNTAILVSVSPVSKKSDEKHLLGSMSLHEQVAGSSSKSDPPEYEHLDGDHIEPERKDTNLTDSYARTPEPQDGQDALNPTDDDEKDELYEVLAPKQPIAQQMKDVLDNVADETKLQSEASPQEEPAYDSDHHLRSAGNDSYNYDSDHTNNYLKSTLKKDQRAWVDPWEAAVQDTFYHKQIKNLRPTFDIVNSTIQGVESFRNLFDPLPRQITEYDEPDENPDDKEVDEEDKALKEAQTKPAKKFGPWDGVMVGCLLNIFGVIMFLRVGFVVGQAGIIGALVIMGISAVLVLLTALSMSAICTNGTILSGGAYYMISRALGPSVGGAVGLLFSFGNMVACSMYLIGFAETLVSNLDQAADFQIFDDPVMDVRIWSNVVLLLVLILAIVGLKYVVSANMGLLVFITCAIILFFVGSFYRTYDNPDFPNPAPPPETITYRTITPEGWTNGNLKENMSSGYADGYNFFSVLAIFFPAVTGIMAGANISGDLRNPSSDIPKGTLTAIGISTVVYMIMAVFVGAVTVRYELLTNELVMSLICVNEYIVLIGVYAATLSSAIASLVGAPRILMAVAQDRLFPFKWLDYFAITDSSGNPIRGYFLSFGVAFACNMIGALNAIAPLISQFFMLTYLLINAACFTLELSKSPGWRPSFKYFNKWTSGTGALMCFVIMFLLNWVYGLVACVIAGLLFAYVYWKDPEVNWGAAPQARKFYTAYKAILRLRKTKSHIKNWRPGLLVLVRDPIKRAQMMLFAQTLKKGHGPIFYATVHTGDYRTNIRKFHEAHSLGYLPFNAPKNSKGFYESVLADTLRAGVQNLFQLVGMGSLRPNTLVIGFKRKWRTDSDEIITEYVQILRDTLVMGMGLMISTGFKRVNWFLDEYAPPALLHDIDAFPEIYSGGRIGKPKPMTVVPSHSADTVTSEGGGKTNSIQVQMTTHAHTHDHIQNVSPSMPRNEAQEEAAIFLAQAWAVGQGKDTVIDVWWMIDDGGLCMLIPYIMKLHKFWQRCDLRMLMVSEADSVSTDVSTMKQLIENFRLPYKGPLLVEARKEPHPKTIERFENLAKCKLEDTPRPSVIKKWLILSELLFEYSRYSGLNVVTLPIPSKSIKPRAYMALLHMLSDQDRLPPTIIMRGNGESTLTYYSD